MSVIFLKYVEGTHGVAFYVAVVGPTMPGAQSFRPQVPRTMIGSDSRAIFVKGRSSQTSRDLFHGSSFRGGERDITGIRAVPEATPKIEFYNLVVIIMGIHRPS